MRTYWNVREHSERGNGRHADEEELESDHCCTRDHGHRCMEQGDDRPRRQPGG